MKQVIKKQESDLGQFSNISPKASASTQTVSYKKLIKPLMHSAGVGKVVLGNPIHHIDANAALKNKHKNAVSR